MNELKEFGLTWQPMATDGTVAREIWMSNTVGEIAFQLEVYSDWWGLSTWKGRYQKTAIYRDLPAMKNTIRVALREEAARLRRDLADVERALGIPAGQAQLFCVARMNPEEK